jgi:hypothetical protein
MTGENPKKKKKKCTTSTLTWAYNIYLCFTEFACLLESNSSISNCGDEVGVAING